jgi:hypothetical protein
MLILECSQGCYAVKLWPADFDLWPWKWIGLQILLRTKYVLRLVKIHWRMLILECSQRCYAVKCDHLTLTFDLWPWKSIGFQILLWTNYVGTYKVRNEIETKRNETKRNQRKRNETKRNQQKRNETKSTKWKRNKTKPTKAKRNQRKQNEIENGRKIIGA